MSKIAFIIPTVRDISLYGASIESIAGHNNLEYDVHLAINVDKSYRQDNVFYHADRRLDGPISALNDVIHTIKDDYDYFISFTDETRLIDNWEQLIEIIEHERYGITSLSTIEPGYFLPSYGEPDSPPYDYGKITIMRFPAFKQTFLQYSQGKMFNEYFKYAASDLWLSYWLTYMGQPCKESGIRLNTIPRNSQVVDSLQKIQSVRRDLYTFFALVNKHHSTQELSYNMGPT